MNNENSFDNIKSPWHKMPKEMTKSIQEAIVSRLIDLESHDGPIVGWVPSGDYLSVFWEDVPYYAVSCGDVLTLYWSIDNLRVVGCKVCNLTSIMSKSL